MSTWLTFTEQHDSNSKLTHRTITIKKTTTTTVLELNGLCKCFLMSVSKRVHFFHGWCACYIKVCLCPSTFPLDCQLVDFPSIPTSPCVCLPTHLPAHLHASPPFVHSSVSSTDRHCLSSQNIRFLLHSGGKQMKIRLLDCCPHCPNAFVKDWLTISAGAFQNNNEHGIGCNLSG